MLVLAQFNKNLGGVYVTEFKRMFINSCINWENSTLAVTSLASACVPSWAELRHQQQTLISRAAGNIKLLVTIFVSRVEYL